MSIYFFIFSFILMLVFFYDLNFCRDQGVKFFCLFVIFLALSFTIGLRYKIGPDWYSYEYYYNIMRNISISDVFMMKDPGYQFVNYISFHFSFGMLGVNLICGVIFSYCLIRFCNIQENVFLAILVAFPYLFLVVSMGYSRQGVAIGLILLSLIELKNNNIYRYILFIFFAALFHKTAIIMAPVIFLITDRSVWQKIVFGIIFFIFSISLLMSPSTDYLIYTYIESNRYSSQGALIRIIMSLIPSLIFIFYRKYFHFNIILYRFTLYLSYASCAIFILLMLFPNLSTFLDRIALYLIPIQILVFSNLSSIFDGNSKLLIILSICFYSFLVLFVWLFFASHANAWIPYKIYPYIYMN